MLSSPASMLSFTGTAAHKDRALCSKSPAYTPFLFPLIDPILLYDPEKEID